MKELSKVHSDESLLVGIVSTFRKLPRIFSSLTETYFKTQSKLRPEGGGKRHFFSFTYVTELLKTNK